MTDMNKPSMTFVNDISFNHVRILKISSHLTENSIHFHVFFFKKGAPVLSIWNNKVPSYYSFPSFSFLPSLPHFIFPFVLFSLPSFLPPLLPSSLTSFLPSFLPPSLLSLLSLLLSLFVVNRNSKCLPVHLPLSD